MGHSISVYQALVEHAVDPITLIDEHGVVIYQNPACETYFGWTPGDLIGTNIFDYLHPSDLQTAIDAYETIRRGEDQDRIVLRFRNKEGNWRIVEVVASNLEDGGRELMILNTRDVTEHREMLDQLTQSEERFRAAFDTANTIFVIFDMESSIIVDVNPAWTAMTGHSRDSSIGRSAVELGVWKNPSERDRLLALVDERGSVSRFRVTLLDKDNNDRTILIDAQIMPSSHGQRIYFAGVDVTERERFEEQLRQSQRIEAIGQLTSGIVHDFNNMLTVIRGHVELGLARYMDETQTRNAFSAIHDAALRGSDHIEKLVTFSREQDLNPEFFSVGECVNEMVRLLGHTLGSHVGVEVDINDTWQCNVDRGLLENAILNMSINARDAMPAGGNLRISTADVHVDGESARFMDIAPGDYVRLDVADDGKGMSEETQARVFEPFYTTKSPGDGTGLGMSMVFGFVRQSLGHIKIDSEPGRGTTISLYLPRS